MARVCLREPLKRLAGNRAEHAVDGGDGRRALVGLERAHPAAGRLDPRRARASAAPHQRVRQRRARRTGHARSRPGTGSTSSRRSREGEMTELLVGTKKGLFVLEGEPGAPFAVTARAFAGEPVEYALRDPRSGRVLASVTRARSTGRSLVRRRPGRRVGAGGRRRAARGRRAGARADLDHRGRRGRRHVYAGGDPGVLFESRDGGATSSSTARSGSTRPGRSGSRAAAGCACTRS